MPDTWRCECGYTNIGAKTCMVCRRPRQAVPPPRPEPVAEPLPDDELAKRPVRARPLAAAPRPKRTPAPARATKKRTQKRPK